MNHWLAGATPNLILLIAAYAFALALLLNLSLRSPWRRSTKLTAMLLGFGLCIAAYEGYRGMLGWAAPTAMPEAFRLHWVRVQEPDKASGAGGAIFFWASRLDEAGLVADEPRAYRTSWDLATARQAEEALAMLKDGELLNGHLTRDAVAVQEDAAERPTNGGGASGPTGPTGQDEAPPQFTFQPMPPPQLPPKPAI